MWECILVYDGLILQKNIEKQILKIFENVRKNTRGNSFRESTQAMRVKTGT